MISLVLRAALGADTRDFFALSSYHVGLVGLMCWWRWGSGYSKVSGWRDSLRVCPLSLHRTDLVDALEPHLGREVEACQVVVQKVGPVALKPCCFVEIAQQGVVVAHVLQLAVDSVDVAQAAGYFHAVVFVLRALKRIGIGIAGRDLVSDLILEADHIHATSA